MLKQDVINTIIDIDDTGEFLKKDVAHAVDIILDTMEEALVEGKRIEIRGFGCFSTRQRQAKSTKNPRTGEIMDIPARKNIHFTMSKSLKEALIDPKQ